MRTLRAVVGLVLGCIVVPSVARAQAAGNDSTIVVELPVRKMQALERTLGAFTDAGLLVTEATPAGLVHGEGTEHALRDAHYYAIVTEVHGDQARVVLAARLESMLADDPRIYRTRVRAGDKNYQKVWATLTAIAERLRAS